MEDKATYTNEDVMQAVACALAFSGAGIGLAAQDVTHLAADGKPSSWGVAPDSYGAMLMPGCGITIHLSGEALRLLAMAQDQLDERCDVKYRTCGGHEIYDLRKVGGERAPDPA